MRTKQCVHLTTCLCALLYYLFKIVYGVCVWCVCVRERESLNFYDVCDGERKKCVFHAQHSHLGVFFQFIRMAAISPQDVIQSILEKLEVMNNKSQPLRIHCIDYNRWPEDVELPSMKPQPSPTAKDDEDWITVKLQKDLWSICEKTGDHLHIYYIYIYIYIYVCVC